jgi:hypothetical protein
METSSYLNTAPEKKRGMPYSDDDPQAYPFYRLKPAVL